MKWPGQLVRQLPVADYAGGAISRICYSSDVSYPLRRLANVIDKNRMLLMFRWSLRSHLFDESDNCRVIQIAAATIHQCDQHLLKKAGQRQGNLLRLGRQ